MPTTSWAPSGAFDTRTARVAEHGVLLRQRNNITSFAEDRNGELYAVAYDGHIYAIAVPN